MIQIGDIVKLNDDKKYSVLNKITIDQKSYLYLMTLERPLEIIIATESFENEIIVLNEVKSNAELDFVLERMNEIKFDIN